MEDRLIPGLVAGWLASIGCAAADNLAVDIVDEAGRPVADAVVSVVPLDGTLTQAPPAPAAPPEARVIDQSHEMFIPLVTVIRQGGTVNFTNNDLTQHHVYSFSKAKRFQLLVRPGERSPPLSFDQAGVVAIGCNIHDGMVTYVFVTDAPFTALTHEDGHAEISGLAAGEYRVSTWHPDLKPGATPPETVVQVSQGAHLRLKLAIVAKSMTSMHEMRGY
jgi:plastocyanin